MDVLEFLYTAEFQYHGRAVDVFASAFKKSKSEIRREIKGGGIRINDRKIDNSEAKMWLAVLGEAKLWILEENDKKVVVFAEKPVIVDYIVDTKIKEDIGK